MAVMNLLTVAIETDKEFQLHLFSFVLSRRNKQLKITIQCSCPVAMSSVISLS